MTPIPACIVVVEDEPPIRRLLRASLSGEGYRILEAENAQEGIRLIAHEKPSVVILDLGLPDKDGLLVIQEIREWSVVPILVLSARGQEPDKVAALDAGADDYITKPFGVGELLARIRAALRIHARVEETGGSGASVQTAMTFGPVRVDLLQRRVFRGVIEVKLTKIEFDLLKTFVQHAGKVLTHRFLLREVWGPDAVHETHYIRVFVSSLRKKIEEDPARPRYLLTEQGVGYRLEVES